MRLAIIVKPECPVISDTISCPTGSLDEKKRKKIVLLLHQSPYFLPLDLVPLLPNDLPSNPGLDLPFFLSFLLSFLAAILSVRFFCFAAIEATICSFRSSLNNTNHHNCFHFHKTKKKRIPSFFALRLFLFLPLDSFLQSRFVISNFRSFKTCFRLVPFFFFFYGFAFFIGHGR